MKRISGIRKGSYNYRFGVFGFSQPEFKPEFHRHKENDLPLGYHSGHLREKFQYLNKEFPIFFYMFMCIFLFSLYFRFYWHIDINS